MIPKFLEKLFGPSWKTTLWGGLTLICLLIASAPDSVAFLPDNIEGYVKGVAAFVTLLVGGKFVFNVKDKDVTGGTIPSTNEAEKRVDKDQGVKSEKILEVNLKTETVTVKKDKKDDK